MTAPMAQAGMPKKKRANGYSAMNTRNTASSTARSEKSPMSSAVPTRPGDDGQQQQHHGEPGPPEEAFDLAAEVPEDGDRDDLPDPRLVGERPRQQPPHLAAFGPSPGAGTR